jgi:hypothetical protein
MSWIKKHLFIVRLTSFLLIVLPPMGMYQAAHAGLSTWIVLLIGLVVTGCVLAILAK